MRTIVLDGPMLTKDFQRPKGPLRFDKGKPQEFADDDPFVDELLAMNPDKLTIKQAENHCVPIFREITRVAGAAAKETE
jgi:hypothetical protein